MSQDNSFDAAEVIARALYTPATLNNKHGAKRYSTLNEALAQLQHQGMHGASVVLHSDNGDRTIDGERLSALVGTLPLRPQ
jgi:hypothetical protein